jgi:hypothetical protein
MDQHNTGKRSTVVGGDIANTGMSGGYVVLSLAVVAASAVGVLLVALRFAPSSSPLPTPAVTNTSTVTTPAPSSPAPVPEDLRYEITATHLRPREVRIKASAYGQPERGLTYWFFVEVDYGTNYIEYYPRRKLTGRSTTFDVQLPEKADLNFPRTGRIYGLASAQNGEANVMLQRQADSNQGDFFVKPPGQPASDPAKLPF